MKTLLAMAVAMGIFLFSSNLETNSYIDKTLWVQEQIECLADNIYFEALTESNFGKIAVAFVTINRTKSDAFPKDVCSVVKQRNHRVCQFSWYCSYETLTQNVNKRLYNEVLELAEFVYHNYEWMNDPSGGALFYHASYVKPKWKNLTKTTKIGKHIFYRRT